MGCLDSSQLLLPLSLVPTVYLTIQYMPLCMRVCALCVCEHMYMHGCDLCAHVVCVCLQSIITTPM